MTIDFAVYDTLLDALFKLLVEMCVYPSAMLVATVPAMQACALIFIICLVAFQIDT